MKTATNTLPPHVAIGRPHVACRRSGTWREGKKGDARVLCDGCGHEWALVRGAWVLVPVGLPRARQGR
jgi:hypothetical protein